MQIIFLGTGYAFSTKTRSNTSVLLPDEGILLDCPPDILHKLQKIDYDISKLKYIMISHTHGDHILGLPFLFMYSKYIQKLSVKVIGVNGLRNHILSITDLIYPDSSTEFNSEFQTIELSTGEHIIDKIKLRVEETEHSVPNLSYRIEHDDKIITYSGDTYSDISELATDSDILIHEAALPHRKSKVHCNIDEAIETFERSRSKKMALVHVYPEIHKDFKKNKNIFIPNDLDSINI